MKAGKAYITSLGTTGLLLASSVLLLLVVGALFAYEGWPTSDPAQADTVAIGEGEAIVPASAATERRRARARTERRRAAVRRRAATARTRRDARADDEAPEDATAVGDPVVSGLPAPETDPGRGGTGGSTPAPGGGVGTRSGNPAGGGRAGAPPADLGGAVGQVDPQAGVVVDEVGQAVDDAVSQSVQGLSP